MAATSISRRFYGVRVVVDLPIGKKKRRGWKTKTPAKDMVAVVQTIYPKYDMTSQSKCENSDAYGICLTQKAMKALYAKFDPDGSRANEWFTKLGYVDAVHLASRIRCEVLFDEFMSLLQQYNKRERNVSFYAKQLNITPKYLSSVVKEVSGKTAARWIDESVILEAKALLKYSGMSIQEIAYHLNFSTQSFFGKYFKQHTGTSPSRYKRKG